MKLLLDTHTFLWFIGGDQKLSSSARSMIEDLENQSWISIASLWEIAIKISLGKINLGLPIEILIPQQLTKNGFQLLPISISHLARLVSLPSHHRDPFDRLLITQSATEQMPLVSRDATFDAYGIRRFW